MQDYLAILFTALTIGALVAIAYGLSAVASGGTAAQRRSVFLGGGAPAQHAMSRYHARWYAVAILFLAFDMEMVFMYPWAVVVADIGTMALVEMGMFLLILLLGVLYAWREGALRWS